MLDLQDIQRDLDRLKKTRDVLDRLIELSGVAGALLIESSGEPVVESGAFEGEIGGFATRIANLWSAGQPVGRSLGEASCEEVVVIGSAHHLIVFRAGLHHLLAIAWSDESNLGLARLYGVPAADRLGVLLAEG